MNQTTNPTYFERCDGKIWRAVEAMIVGLETQSKRSDFKIYMADYLNTHNGVCFGCAATCTIQQLTSVNYIAGVNVFSEWGMDRANVQTKDVRDHARFEQAIDSLRNGYLGPLFDYFGKDRQLVGYRHGNQILPILHTSNWEQGLPRYRELLTELKTLDL